MTLETFSVNRSAIYPFPQDGDFVCYAQPRSFANETASRTFFLRIEAGSYAYAWAVEDSIAIQLQNMQHVLAQVTLHHHVHQAENIMALRELAQNMIAPSKRLGLVWATIGCWDYDGLLFRFNPALSWAAAGRAKPVDLKAANEVPGRATCAACGRKLTVWNSGWSLGKYCPFCEK